MARLGDGVLVLPTAPETLRNGDVHHEYRPGSDLHYLTGFSEPDAVLVVIKDGRTIESHLFVRPRQPERETWDGPRHGVKGTQRAFGVERAWPAAQLRTELVRWLGSAKTLFHTLGSNEHFDRQLMAVFRKAQANKRRMCGPAHPAIVDPRPELAKLRCIKDRSEIAALRRAACATAAGHLSAMAIARPGLFEYQVQAAMEKEFRDAGSLRNGYQSIVASGANACILHYVQNDRRMRRDDLLLVDAGAEFDGYTADVTRTFPVSGTFTGSQKAVYRVVLRAQKAGIRAARLGARWDRPHRTCVRHLTRGLIDLGVLSGAVDRLIDKRAYRQYYMHGTSHWLGRDVHDVGPYEDDRGRPLPLENGMVLTVEPGLYFGARDRSVPKELRGIGVRIEDDVLVASTGPVVITAGIPRELRDVEAACAGAR